MTLLSLRDIRKSFDGNEILKGVSLDAEPGEFIALVGPSGCGKSTLLRILAGLETADSGEIRIADKDVAALPPAARDIAMVFQSYALYPHLTAAQNIAVPLAMRRLSRFQRLPLLGALGSGRSELLNGISGDVAAMATALKIDHLLDRKPGQMSGGQRQRVALARAMVRRPAVFLMDEPLSNLDANLRVHARGEIVDLHRRAGVPTVYVTHDQAEALSMADRVAVMIGGALLQLDSPTEIYTNPQHVEVAKFIGQPRINLLSTNVAPDQTFSLGAQRWKQVAAPLAPATSITLGIRPEFVTLASDGLAAEIERIEFLGSEIIVYSRLKGSGESMVAKVSPSDGAMLKPGILVHFAIDARQLYAFGPDGSRLPTAQVTATMARERANV